MPWPAPITRWRTTCGQLQTGRTTDRQAATSTPPVLPAPTVADYAELSSVLKRAVPQLRHMIDENERTYAVGTLASAIFRAGYRKQP